MGSRAALAVCATACWAMPYLPDKPHKLSLMFHGAVEIKLLWRVCQWQDMPWGERCAKQTFCQGASLIWSTVPNSANALWKVCVFMASATPVLEPSYVRGQGLQGRGHGLPVWVILYLSSCVCTGFLIRVQQAGLYKNAWLHRKWKVSKLLVEQQQKSVFPNSKNVLLGCTNLKTLRK